MSKSRAQILARLRAGQPHAPDSAFTRAPVRLFAWREDERIQRFTERMHAVRAEVVATSRAGWIEALAAVGARLQLRNLLYASTTAWGEAIDAAAAAGAALPPAVRYEQPIEAWKHRLFGEVDAALTGTLGGIAETGSLILWPTADEPRLMSLVPPVHIAVLEASALVTTFAEAVARQGWDAAMPTNALLISGPSKSADIEQTLAYGVHGPKVMIVLMITD
ncbi:MAG: lactate utilization protein C [Thiotrichales bacterium]